jgi:hypothetical protein
MVGIWGKCREWMQTKPVRNLKVKQNKIGAFWLELDSLFVNRNDKIWVSESAYN